MQVIYSLQSNEKPVKAVTLAEWIKSSPSTVHATLSRMQRDKLIAISKKKDIKLTSSGLTLAEKLTRRHRLVEAFLCDVLGISWHEVHKHAHVLEHGLTPLVEERLAEFLDFPKSCPHGTPIPGEDDYLPSDMKYLTETKTGDTVEIVIIEEVLEENEELMKFFQDKNIKPGQTHQILEKTDVTKTVVLNSDQGQATLPFDIAENIGVVTIKS